MPLVMDRTTAHGSTMDSIGQAAFGEAIIESDGQVVVYNAVFVPDASDRERDPSLVITTMGSYGVNMRQVVTATDDEPIAHRMPPVGLCDVELTEEEEDYLRAMIEHPTAALTIPARDMREVDAETLLRRFHHAS